MAPKLNRRRAQFVLAKIDEILAWEQGVHRERDTRFVELGQYLCEVRAGQYWRLEHMANFDDFLARRFPDSRRKAYYLMAIHEQLPKNLLQETQDLGVYLVDTISAGDTQLPDLLLRPGCKLLAGSLEKI
jgi:hypothetical protein